MERRTATAASLGLVLALGAVTPGCEREKGPMEKAGEKVDEAVDEVLHPNDGALEKAGRKADEAVDDAKKKAD
jgi:hypothetical protein